MNMLKIGDDFGSQVLPALFILTKGLSEEELIQFWAGFMGHMGGAMGASIGPGSMFLYETIEKHIKTCIQHGTGTPSKPN